MRKVELLPTQDCEAGYGPATFQDKLSVLGAGILNNPRNNYYVRSSSYPQRIQLSPKHGDLGIRIVRSYFTLPPYPTRYDNTSPTLLYILSDILSMLKRLKAAIAVFVFGQLQMLLFPNALCCSPYERHCVCGVTKTFKKFLPANNFCQLLSVTRKGSYTSASNAQSQLHFRDDQQRAFGISNISN